jgi:hypothetical protein
MMSTQRLLDGVVVAEFSQLIAAPLCGLTLADLGASVTKVETPHGDYTRTWAWPGAESAIFHMLNRGKPSEVLDPRRPEDKARARDIAMGADVIVGLTNEAGGRDPAVAMCRRSGSRSLRAWISAATACQIVGTTALNVARSLINRSTNADGSNVPR